MLCELLLLFVPLILPQDSAGPRIEGSLVEAGTGRPIPEAEVTLRSIIVDAIQGGQGYRNIGSTKTDLRGAFSFAPEAFGSYEVVAAKEGWWRPGLTQHEARAVVALDRMHAVRPVRLQLVRPASISGQVKDAETDQPIANLALAATDVYWVRGRRNTRPSVSAKSGPDGRFAIANLNPGDYLVQREGVGLAGLMLKFTEKDAEAIDHDYEPSAWPGGVPSSMVMPIALGSGGAGDVGSIALRKVPFYRAHVSVPGIVCGSAEDVSLSFGKQEGYFATYLFNTDVPCGREFLVRGLDAGSYWIQMEFKPPDEQYTRRGYARFEVIDRNIEVSVTVTRGVDITGRFIVAEGAGKADFGNAEIMLQTVPQVMRGFKVDADGRFRLVNVALTDHVIYVSGIPAGWYVKDIRYNGSHIAGVLSLRYAAVPGSLEIELDDKPIAIRGTVRDGDRPVAGARVFGVKWPVEGNVYEESFRATTGEDGTFSMPGLAPGEWRVFAVPAEAARKLEEPGLLERFQADGKTVNCGPSSVQMVELPLVRGLV